MNLRKIKRPKLRTFGYLVLFLIAIINLYPFLFSVISSFKSNTEIFKSFTSIPKTLKWSNYFNAIIEGHIIRYFFNTIFLCFATMSISAFIGAMASYVLGKVVFKGKSALFLFIIAGMMIPIQSVIIPLAYVFGKLGTTNNYLLLILMFTAFCLPITVLVLTGLSKSIPSEVEEAAVIDGASPFQLFVRVIFPMMKTGIISVSVFNLIQVWNNLLFPLIFITKEKLSTISIGLLNYFGERSNDYGSALAAITLTIVPVIMLYSIFQNHIEDGIISSSVKG